MKLHGHTHTNPDDYPMTDIDDELEPVWTIDLEALTAEPDCVICNRITCSDYSSCQGELAGLVDRVAARAKRDAITERTGSRP